MSALATALDALTQVAEKAHVDREVAHQEGADFAAAISESAPRAWVDWAAALGGGTTASFFDAATRARRWRAAPTLTLAQLAAERSPLAGAYASALADVASAACSLGEPTMRVIGNASVAAAAQLEAAGIAGDARRSGSAMDRMSGPPTPQAGLPAPTIAGASGTAAETQQASAGPDEAAEPLPEKSLEELLAELDALVGLSRVKREVHRQVAMLRVEGLRQKAGLKNPAITRHLVFVGNPGTGKTTVARLVSGIYRALGLLSKGQLVEVDRSELVAGYLGQTAVKTAEVAASAHGGVLFIDEAYSLTGDQYGEEAVSSLVKEMEDHRDELVVIVAGYPEPMEDFIGANPGLASRFRTTITFEDYSDDELGAILAELARGADYVLAPGAVDAFQQILRTTDRGMAFGNGRFARNVLEAAIGRHAWRLQDVEEPTTEQLRLIVAEDLVDNDVTRSAERAGPSEASDPEATLPDAAPHPDAAPPLPDEGHRS